MLRAENVLLERTLLLLVEVVVLDVRLRTVGVHKVVVLLAAVSGVGADLLGHVPVPVGEGLQERYHRERVGGVGEEVEVGDELSLRAYLQVVPRLGLPVVHRILLHAHERRLRVGLAVGVALAKRVKVPVVLGKLVAHLLQLLHLLLLTTAGLFLLRALRRGLLIQRLAQFGGNLSQGLGGEADGLLAGGVVLRYRLVHLGEKDPYLLHQLLAVPLHGLAPDEGVLVRLGLYLGAVYVLHIEGDQPLGAQQQHQLGEQPVYLLLHAVAEPVDGDEIRLLVPRQPDEVHVALERLLHLAA